MKYRNCIAFLLTLVMAVLPPLTSASPQYITVNGQVLRTGAGPLTTGAVSPPADGLYFNAYSTYPTRVVDPATASNQAGGSNCTVSVAGVSGSYKCYKTIQYGIDDWLTAGERRLIVKSATYVQTADLTMQEVTGADALHRVILMGDPGELTFPVISFAGTSGIQFLANKNNSVEYLTIRKLEIAHATGDVSGLLNFQGAWSFAHVNVEFNYIHDLDRGDNNNGAAIAMYNEFPDSGNANVGVKIRYNTLGDIAGPSENACAIQSFHVADGEIYNNKFFDVNVGVYFKGQPSTLSPAAAWKTYNNIFDEIRGNAVFYSIQGAAQPGYYDGDEIYNNLFLEVSNTALSATVQETGSPSQNISFYNNTISERANGMVFMSGVDDMRIWNNASAAATAQTGLAGADPRTLLIESNYNAYYSVQGQLWFTHYGSGTTNYNLTSWKAAYPSDDQLGAAMDPNSITFASLGAVFVNAGADDYTGIGALLGAGKSGTNIGYNSADCGPGWTP